MKKRIMCAIISAMLIASFTACSTQGGSGSQTSTADTAANKSAAASDEIKDGEYDLSFSQRDADSSYDESAAAKITFTDTSAESSSGSAEVSGTTVTIKSEGTYVVSGGCKDGKIVVDADEKAKVQVVFNGIDLTSSGSPFVVKSADKVFITLADGSENTVSDGSSYTDTVGETNVDAAIFSKEDLSINGSGKLTVNGNYKHAELYQSRRYQQALRARTASKSRMPTSPWKQAATPSARPIRKIQPQRALYIFRAASSHSHQKTTRSSQAHFSE